MTKLIVFTPAISLMMLAGCQSTNFNSMAKLKPESARSQATAGRNSQSALAKNDGQPKNAQSDSAANNDGSKSGIELASFLRPGNRSAAKSGGGGEKLSNTDSLEQILQKGHELLADGNMEEAKAAYQRVLNQQPNHVIANHRLAVIADKQHDFPAAEKHYLTALRINDTEPNLLSDLGYSYLLQQRYAESEKFLKRAVEIQPAHSKALNNLGLLYGKMGDYEKCLTAFRKTGNQAEAEAKVAGLFPLGPPPSTTEPFNGPSRLAASQPPAETFASSSPPGGMAPAPVQMGAAGATSTAPNTWDANSGSMAQPQSFQHNVAALPTQPYQAGAPVAQQPAPSPGNSALNPNLNAQATNQSQAANTTPQGQYPIVPQGQSAASAPNPGGFADQWPPPGYGEPGSNAGQSPAMAMNSGYPAQPAANNASSTWPPASDGRVGHGADSSQVWPPETPYNQAQHVAPTGQAAGPIQPMSYESASRAAPQGWSQNGANTTYGSTMPSAQPQVAGSFPPVESPPAWNGGQNMQPQQPYGQPADQAQREATYVGMNSGPGAMFPMSNQPQQLAANPQFANPSGSYSPTSTGSGGYPAQTTSGAQGQWPVQGSPPSAGRYDHNYSQGSVPQQYAPANQQPATQPYQSTQSYGAPTGQASAPYSSQQYSPW